MILVPHHPEAGLFSQINFVITQIEALGHDDFQVDWTSGTLYSDQGVDNLFEELFLPCGSEPGEGPVVRDWPHDRYTWRNADPLYLGGTRWREKLHECWRKLEVRPALIAKADEFCAGWPEPATALHVRNFNIGGECPGGRAPGLEDYAKVVRGIDGPVFLATDNEEALSFFRELLGERLLSRPVGRSADMETEYHLTGRRSINDARDCLVDALVMARCKTLIHSVSNVATAVLYQNPQMDHIYVRADGAMRLTAPKPDPRRRMVRETLADEQPVSVMHVMHPRWSDWRKVYPNGVFQGNQGVDAGTLTHLSDREVELNWLDWEKERIALIKDEKSNFNQLTSFSYEHKPSSQVIIRLKAGLANQMFQYAFGLMVARARGGELLVAEVGWDPPFALGAYGISLARNLPQDDFALMWDESYEEGIENEILAEIALEGESTILLEGYFQNEAFFRPVADEIRRLFSSKEELPEFAAGRTPVAVHVRLADYLTNGYHAPCPASYYREVMEMMRGRFTNPVFLVFSDEPERCVEWVEDGPDVRVMPASDQFHTLGLMQTCKAFIIANSTFSWWAAWLSGSQNVICPDRFLPGRDWEIYPSRWTALPVTFG